MCSADAPWGPAVIVVFVTDPSGAAAPNAMVCAWLKQSGGAVHVKADAGGVAHVLAQDAGEYQVKVWQPGFREFFAERVQTKAGCVTWVHAVTDVPAISG